MLVRTGGGSESACTPDSVTGLPPAATIPLGRRLPDGSCGLPGGQRAGSPPPVRPCSRWGLQSHPGHPGCWCALTAPFHPCLCTGEPVPSAVCSLLHCPAGRPDWVLPSTVPCGVRTFLGPVPACGPARGRPADSLPAYRLRRRRCPALRDPLRAARPRERRASRRACRARRRSRGARRSARVAAPASGRVNRPLSSSRTTQMRIRTGTQSTNAPRPGERPVGERAVGRGPPGDESADCVADEHADEQRVDPAAVVEVVEVVVEQRRDHARARRGSPSPTSAPATTARHCTSDRSPVRPVRIVGGRSDIVTILPVQRPIGGHASCSAGRSSPGPRGTARRPERPGRRGRAGAGTAAAGYMIPAASTR